MMYELDHVVIAVTDLQEAVRDYTALGFTVIPGGVHANQATENALIVFADGTYLELLAATGKEPLPEMIDFSPLLANGPGLVGYALRTDDLAAEVERLRADGFNLGPLVEGSRTTNEHTLRWQLVLLNDEFAPFLIQDLTPRAWRVPLDGEHTTHANGITGIRAVNILVHDQYPSLKYYCALIQTTPILLAPLISLIGPIAVQVPFTDDYDDDIDEDWLFAEPFDAFPFDDMDEDAEDDDGEDDDDMFIDREDISEIDSYMSVLSNKDIKQLETENGLLAAVYLCTNTPEWPELTLEKTLPVVFRHFEQEPIEQDLSQLQSLKALNNILRDEHAVIALKYLQGLTSNSVAVQDFSLEQLRFLVSRDLDLAELFVPLILELLEHPKVDPVRPTIILAEISKSIEQMLFGIPESFQAVVKQHLPICRRLIKHPHPLVRTEIARVVSFYRKNARTVEPLIERIVLKDPFPQARWAGVKILNRLWDRNLTPRRQTFLAEVMNDPQQFIEARFEAAQMLLIHDQRRPFEPSQWTDQAYRCFFDAMEATRHDLQVFEHIRLDLLFEQVFSSFIWTIAPLVVWAAAQADHPYAPLRQLVLNTLADIHDQNLAILHDIPEFIMHINQAYQSETYQITATMIEDAKQLLLNDPDPEIQRQAQEVFTML